MREADFEFLRASFFPSVPTAYKKLLEGLERIERVVLIDQWERGNDTVLILRAIIGSWPFLVNLSVTQTGRFSSYSLRAE